jgi:hypothetical protein
MLQAFDQLTMISTRPNRAPESHVAQTPRAIDLPQ